jgi:hypothetical protein
LKALGEALKVFVDPEKWDAQIGATLAALTGLTSDEAALLWVGLPNISHWKATFMPKATTAFLKIKSKDADLARTIFRSADRSQILKALAASLPADPAAFANPLGAGPEDKTSPVALLAAAWNANMGQRAVLDEALIRDLGTEIALGYDAKTLIMALMEPDKAPIFNSYPPHKFDAEGNYALVGEHPGHATFDTSVLMALLRAIPFIIATRPPEHPIRRALPTALKAAQEQLKNEQLLLGLDNKYLWGEHADRERKDTLRSVGGKETKKPPMFDNGRLIAVESSSYVNLYARIAKIPKIADEPLLLAKLNEESYYSGTADHLRAIEMARTAEVTEMTARAVETVVPEGGDERDPRQSVPALIKEVMETHELSEDAATLYLVLLGWPAPKEKDIKEQLGWTPKVFKAAVAELAAKSLAMEAKRERAGRAVFLPGRWEALKSPLPPIEAWKLPLFGGYTLYDGVPRGGHITWKFPPHLTFQKAWARLKAGDKPGF